MAVVKQIQRIPVTEIALPAECVEQSRFVPATKRKIYCIRCCKPHFFWPRMLLHTLTAVAVCATAGMVAALITASFLGFGAVLPAFCMATAALLVVVGVLFRRRLEKFAVRWDRFIRFR